MKIKCIGKKYYHKGRDQIGIFDEQCMLLQAMSSDSSSIFLNFDGEILEVSRILCNEI